MIIVLIGPPGAGKGTQAETLVNKYGFVKISTGDALRAEIRADSAIGRKAKSLVEAGKLVPDDILFEIIKVNLEANKDRDILLDGYPRNVKQAQTLQSLSEAFPVKAVVHLSVNRSELIARLSGRRVCENCQTPYHILSKPPKVNGYCDKCGEKVIQRADDQEDKISVRLRVYEEETMPVLQYYREKGLCFDIEGNKEPTHVTQDIESIINKFI